MTTSITSPPDALLGPAPVAAKLEQWMDNLDTRHDPRPFEEPASAGALEDQRQELEEFVSITSHHLREPLRKLRVMSDALLQQAHEGLHQSARDLIRRMQNAAWRASDQLDGLREYAGIRYHKVRLPAVDLNRSVQAALLDLHHTVAQSSARVHVAPLPTVRANPGQMRSLFRYLIENAVLYCAPGVAPEVHIAAAPRAGLWEITLQDNGIGFEPALTDRLFRPFELMNAVTTAIRPNALGLTICRKIARAHGGSISVSSAPGSGTCFTLRLPATDPREHAEPLAAA
jgi:light-regulated signal transduction histidine kinase (bacteriophytochrome)